jgi:hypothetical protein
MSAEQRILISVFRILISAMLAAFSEVAFAFHSAFYVLARVIAIA